MDQVLVTHTAHVLTAQSKNLMESKLTKVECFFLIVLMLYIPANNVSVMMG